MFDVFYIGNKPNVVPHEQEVQSLEQAQQLSKTRYCWLINTYTDYSDWDFLWEPAPWESEHIHAFPSQWQRDSETYLIPKQGHKEINYRTDVKTKRNRASADVVVIDHLDNNVWHATDAIENKAKVVKYTKFVDNYLDTLLRIAKTAKAEYLWICSSVCNYKPFDFTWHPDPWQNKMLHVFPSNDQKFGDTFFMHVPSFRENASKCELLDWYNNNFCTDQTVPRHRLKVVKHSEDSHVGALPDSQQQPLVVYTNDRLWFTSVPIIPLWRQQTRTITPLDPRGCSVIVPRDALSHIKTQLWDYEYVDRSYQTRGESDALDVVFIDNGEVNAEENFKHLEQLLQDKPNILRRVSNVQGRVAAYQAAAKVSSTPWFFAVFAKLKIEESFDFSWQPDCLQQPKHYIFHARNPINGLEYGHMAMIAYNKKLVLSNDAPGLDFTLDQAHEVVPILSGVANFVDDEKTIWRTAFREVIKLKHALAEQDNVETEYRLRTWMNKGQGDDGIWSMQGAMDADEYYDSVNGEFDQLKLSYDWKWLNEHYCSLHGE